MHRKRCQDNRQASCLHPFPTDSFKTTGTTSISDILLCLLYRFNITDDFSISPYFGLDFRINLLGKNKYEETYDGDTDSWDGNLFDDDDMDNEAWKRFQAGWHIGVGVDYRIIHIAVGYGTDFNEIDEKSKFATTAITLGLNF